MTQPAPRDDEPNAPPSPLTYRVPERASGWDGLIVPDEIKHRLRGVAARWRTRARVLRDWGIGALIKGDGLVCLFSGPSGTGKSVAAQLIAQEVGLPLYRVNLAGVVSKYIGETEKNLAAILDNAERQGVALAFDEADAVFAKRSDPKGSGELSHNQQVAYLLDRIERYHGLVFLTTNHDASMDEAFRRRFAVLVRFPMPDARDRARIFQLALGRAPLAGDIDWTWLAKRELSGGTIQKIAYTAASLAAASDGHVSFEHLKAALDDELDALGHLH